MKNIALCILGIVAGSLMVSGSFIDFGLPNAGPDAPGQTFSSILGAVFAISGVIGIVQELQKNKAEAKPKKKKRRKRPE